MAELIDLISANFDYQNFFSAKLSSGITASDTDIPMDAIPTASEGVLVIDWDVAASREVIFFNSKTASKVVCPSAVDGRGHDNTTATTHLSGANVIMAPVRSYFRLAQQLATTSTAAWKPLGYTPSTIVDNGNRQYTMVFNSVDLTSFISTGMKLRGDPATTQPTQCADLESGSTQYFNDTTPAGMTFTDDFTLGAWVKPESFAASMTIISRTTTLGTNGFALRILGTSGRIALNANAANFISYSSVPLGRWTHLAGSINMSASAFAAYKDGVSLPIETTFSGVSMTQSGNLTVGAYGAGSEPFDGKIAQAFVSSAVLTGTQINLIKNQGITTADTATYSMVSAYSLSGASGLTDLNTTNANNLTAQGGALTTSADSPFGIDDTGTPGNYEWGIVTSKTFATNTTITVQAPEGSAWPTLPTSAMITSMDYSTDSTPFGFPKAESRWELKTINPLQGNKTSAVVLDTWYNLTSGNTNDGFYLTVPVGAWKMSADVAFQGNGTSPLVVESTLSTTNNTEISQEYSDKIEASGTSTSIASGYSRSFGIEQQAQTNWYFNTRKTNNNVTAIYNRGDEVHSVIRAIPAYL